MTTLFTQAFSRPRSGVSTAAAGFLVAFMLVLAMPVQAQTAAPPSGTRVAVIDISYVFKNLTTFKNAMEGMKTEVQAFEGTLQQRGKQMQALQAKLKELEPGTPGYKSTEAQILQINADGQTAATLKKKEFLEKEAQIYYDTYNQITNVVRALSERYGIGLVVRFNREDITNERAKILEGVNRAVVYQNNLDITDAVVKTLEAQMARPAPVGGAAQPRVGARPAAAPR